MPQSTAIIIGAGPAGLTAAYELLQRTDIKPIIIEQTDTVGGLSRTVDYNGYKMDIGGHRFFSKSDRVMDWWLEKLPMEASAKKEFKLFYQGKSRDIVADDTSITPDTTDKVMLVRSRLSRIYFLRKFFDYPIKPSLETLGKLGLLRAIKIGFSYIYRVVFPLSPENNLEEFFTNRFGDELYRTFFKSYTEKVWGQPCSSIDASWGAQRVKGLSISKALLHALKNSVSHSSDTRQKSTETSLIERFLYPKYGPGQMWEEVARIVQEKGGEILFNTKVHRIQFEDNRITGLIAQNNSGENVTLEGDYVFSSMPVKSLIRAFDRTVPNDVRTVSEGLMYRDFVIVGLLVDKMSVGEINQAGVKMVKDNWIYIQEPDVLLGRLQIYNNWSPYLSKDSTKVWLGLEYFCDKGDELWSRDDQSMIELARDELVQIGLIESDSIIDSNVIRVPKTYPSYTGTYENFDLVMNYLNGVQNLFPIGRNGMHKYNNQDHSMLTAMASVDILQSGEGDKSTVWFINTEQEYHEEKNRRGKSE